MKKRIKVFCLLAIMLLMSGCFKTEELDNAVIYTKLNLVFWRFYEY